MNMDNLLPNMALWRAPYKNRECYVCEKHIYVQIFFTPYLVDEEYTRITDPQVCK
jgi:hypothetical protein